LSDEYWERIREHLPKSIIRPIVLLASRCRPAGFSMRCCGSSIPLRN